MEDLHQRLEVARKPHVKKHGGQLRGKSKETFQLIYLLVAVAVSVTIYLVEGDSYKIVVCLIGAVFCLFLTGCINNKLTEIFELGNYDDREWFLNSLQLIQNEQEAMDAGLSLEALEKISIAIANTVSEKWNNQNFLEYYDMLEIMHLKIGLRVLADEIDKMQGIDDV